jgi:hypothetical protein
VRVDINARVGSQEVRRCGQRQHSRVVWMGSGSAADLRSITVATV